MIQQSNTRDDVIVKFSKTARLVLHFICSDEFERKLCELYIHELRFENNLFTTTNAPEYCVKIAVVGIV